MSAEPALLLYKGRRSVFPIYIIENFSVISSLKSIIFLLKAFYSNKPVKSIFLTSRLIPLQRYSLIQVLNQSLFLYSARHIFKKFPKYHVVWINNPSFYSLYNFLRWDFLVFDYSDTDELKNHHFYKAVFSKGLVSVYSLGRNKENPSLYYLYKDKGFDYQSEIWEFVGVNQSKTSKRRRRDIHN